MAFLKMPVGNTILMTFLFTSFVTRITEMVCGYAEHTYNFADVAHTRPFELAIRANNPGWYHKGMQLFAFLLDDARWTKKDISWGILKDSKTLKRQDVENAVNGAFGEWAANTRLKFSGPVEKPDIKIKFEQYENRSRARIAEMKFLTNGLKLDNYGAEIAINDDSNWADPDGEDWVNLRLALIHELGHCLGLLNSPMPFAFMNCDNFSYLVRQKIEHPLETDDIFGMQELFGDPDSESK